MTTRSPYSRIPWDRISSFGEIGDDWAQQGLLVIPVILIAGSPLVLIPQGLDITSVSFAGVKNQGRVITSGSTAADPLWWPGTGTLLDDVEVYDCLDPRETFEIYEKVSIMDGSVKVDPFTFTMSDQDGISTTILSSRDNRITQLLAEEVSPTDTTIKLVSTVGFPSSGVVTIGRETISYSSISASVFLSGCSRGLYGSKARRHGCPPDHRPSVTVGPPPTWQGRLATLWMALLTPDHILQCPSLMWAGTVGAGIQLNSKMTKWSITLDHITESLTRKVDLPAVTLGGYAHYSRETLRHPLSMVYGFGATSVVVASLRDDPASDYDEGGWHASAADFFEDAGDYTRSLSSSPVTVVRGNDGRVTVSAFGVDAVLNRISLNACWDPTPVWNQDVDEDEIQRWTSSKAAPESCYFFDGKVKIPKDEDFALIPPPFPYSYNLPTGQSGQADIGLCVDTDSAKDVCGAIVARSVSDQYVQIQLRPEFGASDTSDRPYLCTKRSSAQLCVLATGGNAVAALRAAGKALDAIQGEDYYDDLIDWDGVTQALADADVAGIPQARNYKFINGEDSFLAVLVEELKLRGMCLVVRYGRLSAIRLQNYASSELQDNIIYEIPLMDGDSEIPTEVVDNTGEPLATSVKFLIPNKGGDPSEITITDSTFRSLYGDGETIECKALMGLPADQVAAIGANIQSLYGIAQRTLGALGQPGRTIRVTKTAEYSDTQPGDLVFFRDTRIPNWEGTRGVRKLMLVYEVRREFFGGKFRTTMSLLYQPGTYVGYAPEVLVSDITLSATPGQAIITVDTSSGWGTDCFGKEGNGAKDRFLVGDYVALSQIGSRTPIADENFRIVSLSGTNQITVANTPSVLTPAVTTTMRGYATVPYQVVLRFNTYLRAEAGAISPFTQITAFGWLSDETNQTLGVAGVPKRWAP